MPRSAASRRGASRSTSRAAAARSAAAAGVQTIEMNFLPDVYVRCKACGGHRYNRETLEVKYKGKNIDDVLNMTVNMAVEFFENIPNIYQKLRAIQEVGLGYLTLGQPLHDAVGRREPAHQASRPSFRSATRAARFYILDEPTTGFISRTSVCCLRC